MKKSGNLLFNFDSEYQSINSENLGSVKPDQNICTKPREKIHAKSSSEELFNGFTQQHCDITKHSSANFKSNFIENNITKVLTNNGVKVFTNNNLKPIVKKNQRDDSGFYHVWFRGSNRYTVLYEDADFIGFLTRCDKAAKKYGSKVTAFVLMNNHVHLQVYTPNLTRFIKALLIGFTQWLNKQKNLKGKLFEGPFSSSQIYSQDILERNILYIITNPVRAGICKSIKHYPWSSYHFFKADTHNPLHKIIDIDTSVMKSLFESIDDLNRKADNFLSLDFSSGFQKNKEDKVDKADKQRHRIPDSEIARHLKTLLKGKSVDDLSKEELSQIVKILIYRENATIQQIAALTHETYYRIRKISL